MTLTDDDFASIVAAVEEGRGIFGNIKKYLMYLLSLLVVYTPFLQKLFGTYRLSLADWMIVLIPCLTISAVLEAAKWMGRRGWLGEYEPFDGRVREQSTQAAQA